MKFAAVPLGEAEGAVLAHSADLPGRRLKKGHVLTAGDLGNLRAAGRETVIVARLETGDLGEDEAARRIAEALLRPGIRAAAAATGRVNLHAETAGVFCADKALVDAVNAVDPAITLATLADFAAVRAGDMVATVKIIPFAVAGGLVDEVVGILDRTHPRSNSPSSRGLSPSSKPAPELGRGDKPRDDEGRVGAVTIHQHDGGGESDCVAKSDTPSAIALHPFRPHSVHLIQTELPVVKRSVLDKTARLTQARLDASGSRIAAEDRCAHDADALAPLVAKGAQNADMTIVFGASAVVDADDVIPAAIRAAGGEIVRFGMPVDPGNLLVLGHVNGKPVIGAPGCARSPKENGFDWILNRLLAGIDVTNEDIATLGVGGLLMEIPTRPQPRETVSRAPARVEAIILAAGQSRRMGAGNKLLATFDGEALIRRVARIALASSAAAVTVVTGNRAAEIGAALAGLDVRIVHNPEFADGMSTSLRAGLEAIPAKTDGALVMLGDMPGVTANDLDLLVDAFREAGGSAIVRATHNGKRGNPVILPRALFPRVADLSGDVGARHLVEGGFADTIDVELGAAASVDVDTPEALAAAGGTLAG